MSRGERLKEMRKIKDLTQKQFAEKCGIKQSSLSYIESNDNADFSPAIMTAIINLGINLNWVITGRGNMFLTDTPAEPERDLAGELEERIRRIKIDVSDIEDTVRRLFQKRG
jgi:transcriptional regulator with XRE-family HTH domain